MPFLPLTIEEVKQYGWDYIDFVYITGDAYIDHPSFGPAIITRILENFGYRCAIISQPQNDNDFKRFGNPRLGFLVSSGNIDSMVNHYSVSKKRRSKDFYTPNGQMGKRPDRAVIKYCNTLKRLYPKSNIIIGGIEASLRRLGHYDYWSDSVMKSILIDSKADLLLYGMGEKTIIEVADCLNSGLMAKDIIYIRNTCFKTDNKDYIPYDSIYLPKFNELKNKMKYVESFNLQYQNTDPFTAKPLCEEYDDCFVIQNPPEYPLTKDEMDLTYNLPYMRDIHPEIKKIGHVPAIEEVKFSIIANRGCFGGCNFCALTFHQGRIIQSRSKESIINEAKLISNMPDFKGYIHDVGGPTANFYHPACDKQLKHGVCTNKKCIGFKACNNLKVDHNDYLNILRELRMLPNIKKVFVRSGIRYDYVMYDKSKTFIEEIIKYHTSGQLKVAPEHVCDKVLIHMNKPSRQLYDEFVNLYYELNKKYNLKQFLVPYLMSSHPGSDLNAAIELACYLHENKMSVEQVQDFYPTPSTASTCMYYTGIDPFTLKNVYVAKDPHEKAMQRALMQWKNPKNYYLVYEALSKANRYDLIGNGKKCLIKEKHY